MRRPVKFASLLVSFSFAPLRRLKTKQIFDFLKSGPKLIVEKSGQHFHPPPAKNYNFHNIFSLPPSYRTDPLKVRWANPAVNPHLMAAFNLDQAADNHILVYRPKRGKFKSLEAIVDVANTPESTLRSQLKTFVDAVLFEGGQLPHRVNGESFQIQASHMEL